MTRILVYTAVFGGYDRVFPPLRPEPGVDYVVITDDPHLRVRGWRTVVADVSALGSRPNRHYKMLGHRLLSGYDVSIWVDGNIRPLGDLVRFARAFQDSGAALGVYRHPLRSTVAAEVEACLQAGKVKDESAVRAEWRAYVEDGFPDADGLIETGVLLKNHHHPDLNEAMELWWALFHRHESRDQISLPYVLWKTRLPCMHQVGSFRSPNRHFGIYPHAGRTLSTRLYAGITARSFGSRPHRLLLAVWHLKWNVQRHVRGLRGMVRSILASDR